jgi:hypothetical protein
MRTQGQSRILHLCRRLALFGRVVFVTELVGVLEELERFEPGIVGIQLAQFDGLVSVAKYA